MAPGESPCWITIIRWLSSIKTVFAMDHVSREKLSPSIVMQYYDMLL